ncbi:hypothetical protein BD779DRAFT_1677877 [Infundibulicybe gibba]|nr:hypothetical protein BD779DRAFT_1677877 [Infundibulicybe gibba]
MGRRKIHNTPAERLLANRAKSKRSYDKHKAVISVRRSVHRRERIKRATIFFPPDAPPGAAGEPPLRPLENAPPFPPMETSNTREPLPPRLMKPSRWHDLVHNLEEEFSEYINGSPAGFVDKIYVAYDTSRRKDTIRDAILALRKYLKISQEYEGAILQAVGVGSNWHSAQSVSKRVLLIIHALEELLCYAMEGPAFLHVAHNDLQLMYQSW